MSKHAHQDCQLDEQLFPVTQTSLLLCHVVLEVAKLFGLFPFCSNIDFPINDNV